MRKLNDQFIKDLQQGSLKELLEYIKHDDTLSLDIRENYINVYYRGGNLLQVTQKSDKYSFFFDTNYCIRKVDRVTPMSPKILKSCEDYIHAIPLLKREMDYWLNAHPKLEREIQQLIARENNWSAISGDTDYYIVDIEYANSENNSRFDMVAVKWPSTSAIRKNRFGLNLALIELKVGDDAMTGSAGIVKHFEDINKFINKGHLGPLIEEAQEQFNQKISLGLVSGQEEPIKIKVDAKLEFILICANHKPTRSVLDREIKVACNLYPDLIENIEVKVAHANYMGYGLYESNMRKIQ